MNGRAKVFINYRGADAGWAVHLDNVLSTRFGADRVFRASRSIQPSEDFIDRILSTVEASKVLVAVVGSGWLAATDRSGRRALDNADDWVRREIAYAFAKQVPVLPLLVDDAPPLQPDDLPHDIAQLARCQYLRMSYRSAETDTGRLRAELVRLVPELRARRWTRPATVVAVSLAAVLAVAAGTASYTSRSGGGSESNGPTASPSVEARAPWINLRPEQGSRTAPFQVHGYGFPPRQRVTISISDDGGWTEMGSTSTNEFGEFFTTVDPKGVLTPGEHVVSTNVNNDSRYNVKFRYLVLS